MSDFSDQVEFVVDAGFVRATKAVEDDLRAQYADQLSDGDLLIAGWGANFEVDRQDEAFAEGAFERGLKTFVDGEATLAYHHKHDHVLGRVLAAEAVPGKGVHIVARVDNQPESSPLRGIYSQVKNGTLNALSAGGFFRRSVTAGGPRITDVDLTEWSITGVPVGKNTRFQVIAGKALEDLKLPAVPTVPGEIRDEDLNQIGFLVDDLTRLFDRISKRGNGANNTDGQTDPMISG